jgi:exodeoxyribonuclease VII large subunit
LRIDGYNERIFSALNRRVERAKEKLLIYSDKVSEKALLNILSAKADAVAKLEKDANIFISIYLERQKESLAQNAAKADALSPLSTLFRGYSIAETKNGIIKSISDVKDGDDFTLIVSDGKIGGKVTKIENGDINS